MGKLLSSDQVRAAVLNPLEQVSKHRRPAAHNERAPSQPFHAFEEFGEDIRSVVGSLEALRDELARRLDVNISRCEERASALESLPTFDEGRPVQPNYAIARAFQMEGKQITKVRGGEVVSHPGWPEMEALVLEFSDGSLMTLEFASNLSQVLRDLPVGPETVRLRFHVTYVPPMLPCEPVSGPDKSTVQILDLDK